MANKILLSYLLVSTLFFLPTLSEPKGDAAHRHLTQGLRKATRAFSRGQPGDSLVTPLVLYFVTPHKTGSVFLRDVFTIIGSESEYCFLHSNDNQQRCGNCIGGKERPHYRLVNGWPQCDVLGYLKTVFGRASEQNTESPLSFKDLGLRKGVLILTRDTDTKAIEEAAELSTKVGLNCIIALQLRHPFDLLVSQYYSFGFNHPLPPHGSKEDIQQFLTMRQRIQNQTVDQYVKKLASSYIQKQINLIESLIDKPHTYGCQTFLSRYETMVSHFSSWTDEMLSYLQLSHTEINEIKQKLEPKANFQKNGRHKMFVQGGAFLQELSPPTVTELLSQYGSQLAQMGYV